MDDIDLGQLQVGSPIVKNFVDPIAGMALYGPTVARPELRGRITRSA
jgi:hypothetical protein